MVNEPITKIEWKGCFEHGLAQPACGLCFDQIQKQLQNVARIVHKLDSNMKKVPPATVVLYAGDWFELKRAVPPIKEGKTDGTT